MTLCGLKVVYFNWNVMAAKVTIIFFLVIAIISSGHDAAENIEIVEGIPTPKSGLTIGYYNTSCPYTEQIVESRLNSYLKEDIKEAAAFLHIFFHDCFVTGCDASVLLANSSRAPAEYVYTPNLALRKTAFHIIDHIKQELEAACPQTVSCADIVALAARDSVHQAGGPWIAMPTGRRDGLQAASKDETNLGLPPPSFNVTENLILFKLHGLDAVDLVALSGAHTFGVTHCGKITRVFSKNGFSIDPTLDPSFLEAIVSICPSFSTSEAVMQLDGITPNVFDNMYYVNLENNKGLFISDQTLMEESTTKNLVEKYANEEELFMAAFAKSLVKMGSLGVYLTGDINAEIRLNCSIINADTPTSAAL